MHPTISTPHLLLTFLFLVSPLLQTWHHHQPVKHLAPQPMPPNRCQTSLCPLHPHDKPSASLPCCSSNLWLLQFHKELPTDQQSWELHKTLHKVARVAQDLFCEILEVLTLRLTTLFPHCLCQARLAIHATAWNSASRRQFGIKQALRDNGTKQRQLQDRRTKWLKRQC